MKMIQRINSNHMSECFNYTLGHFDLDDKTRHMSRWMGILDSFSSTRSNYCFFSNCEQITLIGARIDSREFPNGFQI